MATPKIAFIAADSTEAKEAEAALVARYGLPIYPATRQGLLQAMGRFLT